MIGAILIEKLLHMPAHLIPSDRTIRAIAPGDPRKRLTDGDGLYLLLFVKGRAHGWRLDYSIGGRRKTLSLGTYPDVGLALARTQAAAMRKLVAAGIDPSEARQAEKESAARRQEAQRLADSGLPPDGSFQAVALEWLDTVHADKVSAGHAATTRTRFERDVFPWLGAVPVGEVKAPALLECLRRVEARGAIETAHRIKDACGQVFRYAIATGRCERDPAADLRGALKPVPLRHRAAITEPKAAGELLRAIDSYRGSLPIRSALRLAALLFQRPGELRAMQWAELDLEAGLWTIPAARMKRTKDGKENGADHLVPLPPQAVTLLRELQPLTGSSAYVFPSPRTPLRPMSNNAILSALRRMGFEKDEMSGHGFRAMARTMLAERLAVPDAVIEAQLAHSVRDALGRAYNRTQYLEQRRDMMNRWAEFLDKLKAGGEVIPLRDRAA
jgi:integrase